MPLSVITLRIDFGTNSPIISSMFIHIIAENHVNISNEESFLKYYEVIYYDQA